MRVTVLVLAVLGGLVGLVGVFAGSRLLGLATFFAQDVPVDHPGLRLLVAFAMAVVSIVGGAVMGSDRQPATTGLTRRWAIVLVVAAIAGTVAAGRFFVLGGVLTLIAGGLALTLRSRAEPVSGSGG